MPQIVIIIDELADLMMVAAKEIEDSIAMAILDGSKFEQNQICVDCVNNKLSVNFDRNNEEHIRCFSNSIENSVLK